MQNLEPDADQVQNLRRTMRDLVALSTLPAIWTGHGPEGIAQSLADVLVKTVNLDLIYIRLQGSNGVDLIEVTRSRHADDENEQTQIVRRALAPYLESATYDGPATISDPLGDGTLQTTVVRFGHSGDFGVMIAGSERDDFPNESDRLLLGVGANQTAIVIQRKQAEQALQKEREWLRVTLSSIGDGVIATDTDGNVTFLNRIAQSLTGWSQDEAAGQPLTSVFSIIDEQTRQHVESPVEKVLRDGVIVAQPNHTILIARDGAEHPIDDSAAPIRDRAGNVMGVVLAFRDVTERRALERENAKREEHARFLAAIITSSNDAIISKTLDGIIQSWNASAERIFGYTAEQAIGRHITMLIPKERIEEEDYIIAQLRAGQRVEHFETVRIRSDGRRIFVSLTISPIRDAQGRIIGASKIARDITEQKEVEERFRESELRFVQLADAISQLAWMANPDGQIDWFNNRWYEYTGTTFEQMEGWGWQSVHDPDVLPEALNRWKKSLSTGEPFDMVFPIRGADGQFRPFLTRAVPFRDDDGNIVRWFGTNTDITEQEQTKEKLKVAAARLSEADRRKDEFLATLAHELRNPLAPIRTGLEVMTMVKDDPATLEEIRCIMERQTQQLITLVDDLLDVSRITQGKFELRRSRVRLADVVQSAVEACQPFIDEADHELSVSIPDEPIYLNADPHRLAQVFSNLLNNSTRYTPDGGRIVLSAERDESDVVVTVKDNGLGIPAEMIDRIFERFAQIDRPQERASSGLGLGLSLVKSLVEMHGGEITVHSEGTGAGSTFSIRLPAWNETPSATVEATKAKTKTNGLRILVVDDNKAAADMLGMSVRILGNDVRKASDGKEGIEVAAEFRPDVVLMDLGMPKMNGYDAARHIRQQPWGKNILLVALSGWGQDEDKRKTKEAGFDHHLVKPAEPSELTNLFANVTRTTT